MSKLLIRVPNWLGDAVMSTCAVRRFCFEHPLDEITLFGDPASLEVFLHFPHKPTLRPYYRKDKHSGFIGFRQCIQELKRDGFDRGILLTNSFSSAWMFFLSRISERKGYKGQFRSGLLTQSVAVRNEDTHQAARYDYLLNDGVQNPLCPQIYVNDAEREAAYSLIQKLDLRSEEWIGMAVGAMKGNAKRWPIERYAGLARQCVQNGLKVVLFGTLKEKQLTQFVCEYAGKGVHDLAGQTTLRELFALIEQCPLMLTNDSGAMHVATALQTPLLAIFGPTDPQDTGPLGEMHTIIRVELECSPCKKAECPLEHHQCMRKISIDTVFEEIESKLRFMRC